VLLKLDDVRFLSNGAALLDIYSQTRWRLDTAIFSVCERVRGPAKCLVWLTGFPRSLP
jgi:hypothetical protein